MKIRITRTVLVEETFEVEMERILKLNFTLNPESTIEKTPSFEEDVLLIEKEINFDKEDNVASYISEPKIIKIERI